MTIEQELIKAQATANENAQRAQIAEDAGTKLAEKLKKAEALLSDREAVVVKLTESLDAEKEARKADAASADLKLKEVEESVDRRTNALLHERASKLGINPIQDDKRGQSTATNHMTRAEFFQLKPAAQVQFVKSGGKISEK